MFSIHTINLREMKS